jgi:uncharacterized protein (TIGR02996 family)
MTDEKTFIRAIADKPDNDLTRMIYADRLEERGELEAAKFYRQGCQMTRNQFAAGIVAQDDDNDYQESGWVAVVVHELAMLGMYSHCSCYDTWSDLCGGGISDYYEDDELKRPAWKWVGTVEDMVAMAQRKADPSMPGRESSPDDYDHDHLMRVYDGVIAWARAGGSE